jgi:sugar-phosphatase
MKAKRRSVIFDMDGLLIDSEPIWEDAGAAVLAKYGASLTPAQYSTTTGLRTEEWLQYWFSYFGIDTNHLPEAKSFIIQQVISRIRMNGRAMPGVHYILSFFEERGFRLGLATSSPLALAEVVIDKLGIGAKLQAITSAEHLPYGKPHPQVYIDCAAALQADPLQCICFEDSFNGLIAAKAAKMKCVVVPAYAQRNESRWGAADLRISSLLNFNDLLLRQL